VETAALARASDEWLEAQTSVKDAIGTNAIDVIDGWSRERSLEH